MSDPMPENRLEFARTLTDPDFSLSVPDVAKQVIRELLAEIVRVKANRDEWASRMMEFVAAEQKLSAVSEVAHRYAGWYTESSEDSWRLERDLFSALGEEIPE